MTAPELAATLLRRSKRPLLLLGPHEPPVVAAALRLADALGAAVLTTPDAKGLVDDARSAGVFSFGASPSARAAAARADVVLAVTDLGEFACMLGAAFAESAVIQVAEEPLDVGRSLLPAASLMGPLAASLLRLLTALPSRQPRLRWFRPEAHPLEPPGSARPGTMHPAAAIDALGAALPDEVRLCVDVTSAGLYASQRWRLKPSQRLFSSIERSACMGEALLASIGIRLASGCPTLALVGDWGYLMAPAELHTVVEHELDRYVIVVWANAGGALVGAGVAQQRIAVPEASFRWRKPPSFAALGRSLGARSLRVTTPSQLSRAVSRGLRAKRPVLIQACIDEHALVPAGDRFLSLGLNRD